MVVLVVSGCMQRMSQKWLGMSNMHGQLWFYCKSLLFVVIRTRLLEDCEC